KAPRRLLNDETLLNIFHMLRIWGVTCPPPMSVEHADIRVKSYSLKSRERYTCNSGFKRKAGTSSLTECVLNETTNIAHWTIPNLKCIRDPSLTHLRPSSTEVPAGVTPEPKSTSLSGKEPAFTSKSDTTVATKSTMVPGSRPTPSKPPAAGTTGPISQEPSQAPPQTTAKALEHTPSASLETPGYGSLLQSGVTICGMEKLSVIRIFPKGLSDSLWRVFLYCDTTDLSPMLYLSSPCLDHPVPGSLDLPPSFPRFAHPPTPLPSRAVSLCSLRFWVCFCFCLFVHRFHILDSTSK
uniref:Interleukin-15 receptor subunit alpha n=1 Tax=Neovison vison TaxID=452646 RepID=A0A8C7B0L4_NEOVI